MHNIFQNFLALKSVDFCQYNVLNRISCFSSLCIQCPRDYCELPNVDDNVLCVIAFQCRKYKASSRVRNKAEFLYHKLKGLYMKGDETTAQVCARNA